jgi:DNA repair exonuclease SbcCD ATPase subunit
MKTGDVLVSVAQVAAGGGIVKGIEAAIRRRSELRQLDRQSDSVEVSTAKDLVAMLRTELDDAKEELRRLKADHATERADQQRQIQTLGERVSQLSTDLVVAQAEIARLRGTR